MERNPVSSPQCPPSPQTNDLWRAQGWHIEQNIHSGPSSHTLVTQITLNGLLSKLAYFFQNPIKDHVGAEHPFCIPGSLGMTQVIHLGLSDSYSPTIFQGFSSLTNPPNFVSLVLESLFPSCPLFCHLPLISCCRWPGANGKKDWLGWRGLVGGWVEGRSWVQLCMKLTLTMQTNAKLQLCYKLGRSSSRCHGRVWEDFPRDCQWTETRTVNKG